MAYTWGSKTLHIAKGSYSPPSASNGIKELSILPDSTGNPASIIQQGGRSRKRVSFNGYADETDYYALLTDFYAGTTRTFTDVDSNTLSSVIESISANREHNGIYPYLYSITLLEA